jgi:hypothetical protein
MIKTCGDSLTPLPLEKGSLCTGKKSPKNFKELQDLSIYWDK